MSRGTLIHQVHVADGFADDCEELIHRWLKTETFTYETFCQIWKDMKFGFLFHGRTCGSEIAELSEELIQIAKHYMVANTSNYEESVAGMFLVYALLHLQPFPEFASLRIVPQDLPAIKKIEMIARKKKRYDVLYILGSLLIEGPVQYHAAAREYGIEPSIRKYLEGCSVLDKLGVRPHGVFYRQTEELDLLRELRVITKRYAEAKKAITGSNSRDLNYVNHNFPEELDATLKRVIDGGFGGREVVKDEKNPTKAVKEKAMKLTVDGMRHLQTASTRSAKPTPTKESPKKDLCEIKQKPGAVRLPSPKKPVTSLAKRKRKRKSSDSSENQTTPPNEINSESAFNPSDDLNLDNFDKEKNVESQLAEETEVNISIDSLPVRITEEQGGKVFEIEIIDKLDPKAKEEKEVNNVTVSNLQYGEGTSNAEWKPIPIQIKTQKKAIGPLLESKRVQQKQVVKSKLKRLGILEVASFKEDDKSDKD